MKFAVKLTTIFAAIATGTLCAVEQSQPDRAFLKKNCFECHDADSAKGGLDLTALKFDTQNAKVFNEWVTIHDRVRDGEMPPKKKDRPAEIVAGDVQAFLKTLAEPLTKADIARESSEGRSSWRRLNRYEYENTLRDLFQAPWLQVKSILPEDGESHRFNKIGEALDVSHVQMAQYLAAAEYALHEVMAYQMARPETKTIRYYGREQKSFVGKMKFSVFNTRTERATLPLLGYDAQPEVRAGTKPATVGAKDPATREKEAIGMTASAYEPIEPKFDSFEALHAGHYKLRLSGYSIWVGPGGKPVAIDKSGKTVPVTENKKPASWWIPDFDVASKGRRGEPITLYSEMKPRQLRWLGSVDFSPEPTVQELDVWLLKGETIRPDPARLFRSRPPNFHNPLAEKDGQPGVAFKWLEVEGPIFESWPTAGHTLLFGDLPMDKGPDGKGNLEIKSANPAADSERLLRAFMARAYRRPVREDDVQRFLGVIKIALKDGSSFIDAMFAGYSAVLCSPEFVCLEEKPGKLDDAALAARLSYFIWNSEPDEALRGLVAKGELHKPDVLRAQTERLIADARSRRFVNAFLDYWIDLRKIDATSPDGGLYNDYYLDDLLSESALLETQLFFDELVRKNLPSRNIVASDFAMLNERLANHYGISGVNGVKIRRVELPKDSPRGGLMTQASVLKVTANGTTTSPVIRGVWIMERIIGKPPPPPPPSVPAVEPDIRGATTIREQLEKHRTQPTCNACHAKIDPAGFALENFDVMGGWRDKYRANGGGKKVEGYGKNGQSFAFHLALPVDASGELPGGGKFKDIRELKQLLLKDERQLARNLTKQMMVYATGATIRFGDRPRIEDILNLASAEKYGVRTLIHEIVQSDLFQSK